MTGLPGMGAGGRIGERAHGAADRIGRWWRAASPSARVVGVVLGLAGAVVFGAFLFGAWHVLIGWLMRGSPRAGLFGLGLAAVTGLLLGLGGAFVRRRLPS